MRAKAKHFHFICVEFNDSQCSKSLPMNIPIERAHLNCGRKMHYGIRLALYGQQTRKS